LLGPVVISVLYYVSRDDSENWGTWRNGLTAFGFILLNHYQVTTVVNSADLQYSPSVSNFLGFFAFSEDPSVVFKPQCAGFQDFAKNMILRAIGPIFVAIVVLVTYAGSHVAKKLSGRDIVFDINRTSNIFFSLMFTFFAGISAMALTLFKCSTNPNGTNTLNKDQSIICGGDDWNSLLVVAIFAVLLYVFGIGGLFVHIVYKAPAHFGDLGFRRRWKFLFIKFRPDVWGWALVICGKGIFMNLGFTFFSLGIAQVYWVMMTLGVYCGLTIFFMPWRHRAANGMEIQACFALLFLSSLTSFYVHGTPEDLAEIGTSISMTIIACNLSPIFVAAFLVLRMIWQHVYPTTQLRRVDEIRKVCHSLRQFADAPEAELLHFMAKIDEWGRYYIISALHVINTEFTGESVKPRLSDGKLKSKSSGELNNRSQGPCLVMC